MGWTNPLTATYLGYLTETVWNTHVRDNLLFLYNKPKCTATATTVAVAESTWTTIPLTDHIDNAAMHDNATNNSFITAPVGGTYLVHAQVVFDGLTSPATARSVKGVRIRLNGGTALGSILTLAAGDENIDGVNTSFMTQVSANDYFEMQVYQENNGVVGTVYTSSAHMSVVWV
jgi:hypothetical protein